MKKQFEIGDFVSVWFRESRRHKWKMEHGFVLITSLWEHSGTNSHYKGFSYQSSNTWNHATCPSWSTARLDPYRELREPEFDVKPNVYKKGKP